MRPHRVALALLILCVPFAMGDACAGPGGGGAEIPIPELTITSPADGTFTNDPSIVVTGTGRRGGGQIATLTVNGVDVLPLAGNPQDGTWSTVVPLNPSLIFNEIYAEMTLTGGTTYRRRISVIAGDGITTDYVLDGVRSPESILMRLNDSGLDAIEPVITGLVNLDLATLLPVGTQIINEFCYITIFVCAGTADAFVEAAANPPPESPSISSFTIGVDSQTNQANALVTLNDLFVRAKVVDGNIGIGFTCHLTLTASVSSINGNYALDPDALDPTLIDVTQLGGVNVTFGNFNDSTDCDGIFGFVLEAFIDLFVGSFEDEMRGGFETFLNAVDVDGNTPVAAAIEVALADVDIAGPIGAALGATLDTALFTVDEDVDGITLGSDGAFVSDPVPSGTCHDEGTGVEIPGPIVCSSAAPCIEGEVCLAAPGQCVAPPEAPDFTASYHVVEPFPVLGATTPPPSSLPYGLGLGVSTSAFNQLLKAQFECGLLNQSVEDVPGLGVLSGTLLSLLIPEIAMYPLSTLYKLELAPSTSAIITGNFGPGGELAELRIHGLTVKLRDVAETLPVLLNLSIDARIGLDASLSGGELSFVLGSPDPMTDVDVTFIVNRLGTDQQALEDVVSGLFAAAAPDLASALGSFPLPNFLGLALQDVEVGRAGEFLSLYLDLVPAP